MMQLHFDRKISTGFRTGRSGALTAKLFTGALLATAMLPVMSPSPICEAQDYGQSLYESSGEQNYNTTPRRGVPQAGPAAPGANNVIGYQPMNQNQLSAVLQGQSDAGNTQLPPMGGPNAAMQLPTGYDTGVIGDGIYTLGRDDVINVTVRNQPEFSGNYAIGFDGRIQYNYIGDLPVAGLTKFELEQVLDKLLQKYIRVPEVTVTIVAYNSKVVYVMGEVNAPGKYVMRGDAIKLREAVLAAGLPNRRGALKRVHVIKPDLEDPEVRVVNLDAILFDGKLEEDIDLRPGEVVVINTKILTKIGDVLGEILSPVSRSQSLDAAATRGYGTGY